jgi:mono/diheme cytochrome c family protein
MKTLVKVVAVIAAVLIVVAGAGVGYLFAKYPDVPPPENITVTATPEKIGRGEYLAKHVTQCVDCHAVRDFTKYAGPVVEGTLGRGGENFGIPGTAVRALYSRNITPAGIGQWTDGELIRAITAGVNKNGEPLFPIMPYPRYAQMSREDIEAIVAYVRTLGPVAYTAPPRDLALPLPLVVRTIPKAAAYRDVPPRTDRIAYGEYLTNAASCAECHTPMDGQGTPLPGMDFAGGFEFPLPGGGVVRSANITPDADTGIGTWSEQQFIDKFKAFDGAPIRSLTPAEQRENTTMPWLGYAGMTREDLGAMYSYLRTLKPVINRVPKHSFPR